MPAPQQRHGRNQRGGETEVEHDARRRFGGGKAADAGHGQRRQYAGGETNQCHRCEQSQARLENQGDADKADTDRPPQFAAEAFARPQQGRERNKQRRGVIQQYGLGERQVAEGVEEAVHGGESDQRTQQVGAESARGEVARPVMHQPGREREQSYEAAEEHHHLAGQ